jgi:hypothetical protein
MGNKNFDYWVKERIIKRKIVVLFLPAKIGI